MKTIEFLVAHWYVILGIVVIILENILPYLPTKANCSVQAIVSICKKILSKYVPDKEKNL
jgi:hypothetical protein